MNGVLDGHIQVPNESDAQAVHEDAWISLVYVPDEHVLQVESEES